jgi:hypothetical protein
MAGLIVRDEVKDGGFYSLAKLPERVSKGLGRGV